MEKDKLFEKIETKITKIQTSHKIIIENLEHIDKKIASIESANKEEHSQLFGMINNINKNIENLRVENKEEHSIIFKRLDNLDQNVERIDRRITSLKADNLEEHSKIQNQLDSINTSFIKYETDGYEKIKILFAANDDRKKHQDIYGYEFKKLNDLVAKNSFRISNLEQHFN